ncbi:hypothetical protein [Azospirillum rugosum]|uniref:Uncharacterized protein n=1 Tax=Azospirillum rugosum TaxID=416170 RepID=A0ABS4SWZ6_9PROT|nr:hypothetical protein [Azospirillum rugosum]MBP2296997.1 hypothetical protein [Azospirillum rugosum]MDQ0530629.1 hypothetical protein [Azospirillum rugosum]
MNTETAAHTLVERPAVTKDAIAGLVDSLAKSAAQDGTDGVILAAYLRHLYGGPDPELIHEIGRRHLDALNKGLRARGLPAVSCDEHCFRFLT